MSDILQKEDSVIHGSQPPIILWEPFCEQSQNDCACPTVNVRTPTIPTSPAIFQQEWLRPADLHTWPLNDQYAIAFNPIGHAGPVLLNESAQALLSEFAQPQLLYGNGGSKLIEAGLLQQAGVKPTLPNRQPTTLTAWLHVTNECNLRCTYCYIDKTPAAMDEATGKAAIDAIIRSALQHHFLGVNLKYAGGEATLNFKLVQILHAYAKAATAAAGLQLESGVLSNGVALTNSMLDFLRDENIRLMISLDGSAEEHDRQRVFRNGRGSHHQVTRSIDRALARKVSPYLSITVTGKSVAGLVDAVTFALDRDLLFNLNFYREHDANKTNAELRAEDEAIIAALRSAFAVIEERLPKRSLIGALVDRSSFAGPHQRSCGAGHNYLVVDHKGGVARCQMEIERTVTNVFAQDPLQEIQLHTTGFQNLAVDEKEGCRDCHWRYWCAGGCSLLTYRVTGRNDVKSPYCNVYKAIYPELLRLEGLRLLKWATPQPTNQLYPN